MASSKNRQEDIIETALNIVRESGIESVNAREIAKRLNLSVQPIFYYFANMDELKKTLLKRALTCYHNFLLDIKSEDIEYKTVGLNYIRFAKEESNLFKFIFMGPYHIKVEEFANFDKSYERVEQILKDKVELSDEIIKNFHLTMWMFTHGIACLLATKTVEFSDEEISNLLTKEFEALLKNVIKK